MANLIICCDGTWNNPTQEDNGVPAPTNVVKLYNALAENDDNNNEQLKYYHPGLGGEETGLIDSLVDGMLGASIRRHISSAYYWLSDNYQQGDHVYFFGFSRGAFTVRSLAGLMQLGLLNLSGLSPKEAWQRTHQIFNTYKNTKPTQNLPAHWFINNASPINIHFMGVWDTVGALGIPNDLEFINIFDDINKWQFHDTNLNSNISTARHAMALDEIRSSFTVTRWANIASHQDAQEIWFPGVHSDVGGGYANSDLSDGALQWMISEAQQKGLNFRPNLNLTPNPLGVLHNSFKGIFAKFRSRPRNTPELTSPLQGANQNQFHSSAIKRQENSPIAYPAYKKTIQLTIGECSKVEIFAKERWNDTGLYFEAGQKYTFSAQGEWQDSKDTCDWLGTANNEFTLGDVIRASSSFFGRFEKTIKKLTKNDSIDLYGTKRVEHLPWFIAIGAVTNDNGKKVFVTHDGSPTLHEYFSLPEYTKNTNPYTVTKPGYFYAFPNDVWAKYDNNHGSIKLTITRVG